MAQYKLHCFCQSGNSYKAALYLQLAGLEWEAVLVDFFKGQTRDPKWRAEVNEMGEAPVLEDGSTKLAQSGGQACRSPPIFGRSGSRRTAGAASTGLACGSSASGSVSQPTGASV